jgi:hypothetical protein
MGRRRLGGAKYPGVKIELQTSVHRMALLG